MTRRKKDEYRITAQRLDNAYVRQKIEEIVRYKMDAHHWNRDHFIYEFVPIYEKALKSYEAISHRLGVSLHSKARHTRFLASICDHENPRYLDLQRYAEQSLSASERAALRETETQHLMEHTQGETAKGFFEIRNYLGGVYYLTADEVIFQGESQVIIQESKNSTRHAFPSVSDIKDGLFKLLLYSQLSELTVNGLPLQFTTRLRLTGAFSGKLSLPTDPAQLQHFIGRLSRSAAPKLQWLNTELKLLGIEGLLEGNNG